MIDKDSFTKCNISEIIEVIKGDIIELAINKKVDAIVNAGKAIFNGRKWCRWCNSRENVKVI